MNFENEKKKISNWTKMHHISGKRWYFEIVEEVTDQMRQKNGFHSISLKNEDETKELFRSIDATKGNEKENGNVIVFYMID